MPMTRLHSFVFTLCLLCHKVGSRHAVQSYNVRHFSLFHIQPRVHEVMLFLFQYFVSERSVSVNTHRIRIILCTTPC